MTRNQPRHDGRRVPRIPPRRSLGFWRRPGWPLAAMFVPFPLWWALGLSEFVFLPLVVPMVVDLFRRRTVLVPRGFGWWLLFLTWVAAGLFVLQVDAVGAVPDNSPTRYLTWGYRLGWYLVVTVIALYVLNNRDALPLRRVSRIVSVLFVTVVAGGLLGLLAPTFQFTSLVELVLPHGLTSSQFVYRMVHPTAAQLQDVLGYASPRPSAPYSYSNTWGLNFVVTLPFFVHAWCSRDAGWRRLLAPAVLAAAAVTAVFSINRGMWVALLVMGIVVGLRAALAGRVAVLVLVVGAVAALVAAVAFSPLGGVVQARLTNPGSEQGRTNLSTLAVTSVARTSPVVGLGSTRNVQGNFNTITGGRTANCPRCAPPALGTQGQLWLVVFSQGLLGLLMFLVFFGRAALTALGRHSAAGTIAVAVLVAGGVTLPVYNSLGTGLAVILVAVALLSRELGPLPSLERYAGALWRGAPLVLVCGLVGLAAGVGVTSQREPQVTALTTVVVPRPPEVTVLDGQDEPESMDTIAQLLSSDRVSTAVAAATDRSGDVQSRLSVRAAANSRTLRISYVDTTAQRATRGVQAAADELLAMRQEQLAAQQERQVATLQARITHLTDAIGSLSTTIDRPMPGAKRRPYPLWATFSLRNLRTSLTTERQTALGQLAVVTSVAAPSGAITQPTRTYVGSDQKVVDLLSGLMLGLAAGAVVSGVLARRGPRVVSRRALRGRNELPVLSVAAGPAGTSALDVVLRVHPAGSSLITEPADSALLELSEELDRTQHVRGHDPRQCVLLARPRTRRRRLYEVAAGARAAGLTPIGVVVVPSSRKPLLGERREPTLGTTPAPVSNERKWRAQHPER